MDQRTNGLLKLKMETESAQTDRTIETAKRETELKQKLEAAEEANIQSETKCEEIVKGLNKVLNQAIDEKETSLSMGKYWTNRIWI